MKARFSVLALLIASTLPASAQQLQISKDNKTIAITTSAQAEALADTAVVSIGFRIYAKDENATYAEASSQSNAIMGALGAAGIPKSAIESSSQVLSPVEPANDIEKARYAQGLRFQFSQQWRVTVAAADAAGVLHTAITSGANDSGTIEWKLKDENAIEAEAARKALEHAKQIATRMAEGLGVRLGALVYASNEAPGRGIIEPMAAPARMARMNNSQRNPAPLAISPETITRSATVYAVFAIE